MIKHQHGEAFKLMTYECEACGFHEQIWNSRDGVTPFMVDCRNCQKGLARHVKWAWDIYIPAYKLRPGERKFVDLTRERALELAEKRVVAVSKVYPDMAPVTPEERTLLVARLVGDFFGDGRQPDLITVEG